MRTANMKAGLRRTTKAGFLAGWSSSVRISDRRRPWRHERLCFQLRRSHLTGTWTYKQGDNPIEVLDNPAEEYLPADVGAAIPLLQAFLSWLSGKWGLSNVVRRESVYRSGRVQAAQRASATRSPTRSSRK